MAFVLLTIKRLCALLKQPLGPWKITCHYVATSFNCFSLWHGNSWVYQLCKFPNSRTLLQILFQASGKGRKELLF